jgi:hypothetical protein
MRKAIIAFAILALIAMTARFNRPAIRLEHAGASVVVHVETLGEYPTTIRRVQIKEISTGKVVYELLAENGAPQIYNFKLVPGENSTHLADPEPGSYRIDEPNGQNSFLLEPGVRYRLKIWGNGWLPSATDVQF